jgi:aminoacyl tRNA synthase complex-interacting multifunctional protein 1
LTIKGETITAYNTIARALAGPKWAGNGDWDQAQVAQWMSFLTKHAGAPAAAMGELDASLASRSFFVGSGMTLADLCLFWAVHPLMEDMAGADRTRLVNVARWFDQVQHTLEVSAATMRPPVVGIARPMVDMLATGLATAKPAASKAKGGAGKAAAGGKKGGKKGGKAATEAKPAEAKPAAGAAAAAGAAGAADGKKGGKKKKAAAASGSGGGGGKKKNTGVASPVDESPLGRAALLDIRVGVITDIKKHEGADKLYVETIDVGEDKPRQIVSGLVPYYPDPSALLGKKVLVLCNMKPKKLVGLPSAGMVLCAALGKGSDDAKVEILEPPAGAAPGERVFFAADPSGKPDPMPTPAVANAQTKKKMFEKLMPEMQVRNYVNNGSANFRCEKYFPCSRSFVNVRSVQCLTVHRLSFIVSLSTVH